MSALDATVHSAMTILHKTIDTPMIYNGLFVGKGDIFNFWTDSGLPVPDDAQVKAHHMTSHFRPTADKKFLPYGATYNYKIIGYNYSNRVAAVVIKTDVPSSNAIKHVTVWVANGGTPKESNSLLNQGWIDIDGPEFKGTVGYFDGKKDRFHL